MTDTDSPLPTLHELLDSLESELNAAEALPPPTDPALNHNYTCTLRMCRITIAAVKTSILTIERLEAAVATYCALRSGSVSSRPN